MGRVRDMAITASLAAVLAAGCAPSQEEVDFLARKSTLQRQNQGIRELIAEAERGSLVPVDSFLVGVDERIVGEILRSQLPFERPLGKRFVVHLDSANVFLRDKFGLITLDGNIHRRATPDRRTAVHIIGGLGAVRVDPATDLLNINIAVDQIELREAGILDKVLGAGGKKFLAEKGRARLQDELPTLHVPVALTQQVRIPAIEEGPIRLDSLTIPLDLSVERVLAAGGKLWLTLHANVGKVSGAEEGLGVSVKKKPRKAGASGSTKPGTAAPRKPGGGA